MPETSHARRRRFAGTGWPGRPSGIPSARSRCRSRWTTGSGSRRRCTCPDAPGPFPAVLESIPYRKDDWTLIARLAAPRRVRRGRLRQLPARRARHGQLRGHRGRRVPRARGPRQPGGHRLAGDAGLEHRQGGHVRDQLGWLLGPPGRRPAAAGAAGDRPGPLQPRPLQPRRPLRRRRRSTSARASTGPSRWSARTRCRPTRSASGPAGARSGFGAWRRRRSGRSTGCATSAVTRSGAPRPWGRTGPRSRHRCSPSAASTTGTATPCSTCWSMSGRRAAG